MPGNRNNIVMHESESVFERDFEEENDSDSDSGSGKGFLEDSNKVQSFFTIFPRIEDFMESTEP